MSGGVLLPLNARWGPSAPDALASVCVGAWLCVCVRARARACVGSWRALPAGRAQPFSLVVVKPLLKWPPMGREEGLRARHAS